MITRRAMIDLTHMFQKPIGIVIGDIVALVGNPGRYQTGRVVAIDAVIRKVWVSWTADELILQHDVADLAKVEGKMASEGRRTRGAEAKSENHQASEIVAASELKCNRCGKTIPPVKGYENSAWRHCPCGGVATKKASEILAAKVITKLEMYADFRNDGKNPNQAAEACLDVLTSGMWAAMDENTISTQKNKIIQELEGKYKAMKKSSSNGEDSEYFKRAHHQVATALDRHFSSEFKGREDGSNALGLWRKALDKAESAVKNNNYEWSTALKEFFHGPELSVVLKALPKKVEASSEETHDDKCLCHDCLAKKNSPLLMASSRRFKATLSKIDDLE